MGKHAEKSLRNEVIREREIEDKYWISLPLWTLETLPYQQLTTAYLDLSKQRNTRARRIYEPETQRYIYEYTEKKKGQDPHERFEDTVLITAGEFDEYCMDSPYFILNKRRFVLPYHEHAPHKGSQRHEVIIDCYDFGRRYYPFAVAEIEFRSLKQLARFQPPDWLQPMTAAQQQQVSNSALARYGPPHWLMCG